MVWMTILTRNERSANTSTCLLVALVRDLRATLILDVPNASGKCEQGWWTPPTRAAMHKDQRN
jgi:hypothetical protein